MPKLTPASEAARRLQAIQAFTLWRLQGITKEQACLQVGLSAEQLDRWLEVEPNLVALQKVHLQSAQRMLSEAERAHSVILANLIERATTAADIEDSVRALKYLDTYIAKTEQKLGIDGQVDTAETYSLNGPKTYTEMHLMPDQSGGVTVTISQPAPTLDLEATDSSSQDDPDKGST